jgi:myo-inositol 2-dehydrogenase / D-chiro-inositol 1-dehydrogenase
MNPVDPASALTRRSFLRGSAAAAASLSILPASAIAGTESNSRIEVGIVGLGGRGSLIADLIAEKHKGLHITAVADYFPQVAKSAGDRHQVAPNRRFSGLSGCAKLLASKVDAVFLETPPCFFPDHAALAIEAGVHIYIAKPIAIDVPGCLRIDELAKTCTQKQKCFLVDFQFPTEELNIEVVRRCREGLIGPIALLESFYCDESFPDPVKTTTIEDRLRNLIWVNDIEIGGDNLVNAGIHSIDAALWLAGSAPVSASGASRIVRADPHGDATDVYSITFRFADGQILSHFGEHLSNTHGYVARCTAYGRDGYAQLNYEGPAFVRGNKGGFRGGDVKNLYVDGIHRNLDTFEACIRNSRFENQTAASGVRSTLTAILGRQAAKHNQILTWDQLLNDKHVIQPDLKGLLA